MNYYNNDDTDENTNTISFVLQFIKENSIQILLFILVFVIIYVIDCVSNINATLFTMPSPVVIPGAQQQMKLHKKKGRK
jgi:hypothetical protein